MVLRIIIFLLGILFTIVGMVSLILYLNLLTFGYSFLEYVNFIIRKFECISLFIGLIIIWISISYRRKNEIHL
jgi:hypothetical protein